MANHVELNQLADEQVTPYASVRPDLRSGDLFFAAGKYFISQMIQKCTGSPWSHVGLIFVVPSMARVLLLESVEDVGVRFVPLSKYLDDYDNDGKAYNGMCALARPNGVTDQMVAAMAKFGMDELGRPYDKDEIGEIAARIMLGLSREKVNTRSYVCSELVQACYKAADSPFQPDRRGFISPENIWVDQRVKLLNRIL